jgi:putative peptidoglycan lipid II flippase
VLLTTGLGYVFAFSLPKLFGFESSWGTAGLTSSAGIAGWVEFMLLRASLNSKIGTTGLKSGYVARLWASACMAAAVSWAVKLVIPAAYSQMPPKIAAVLILAPYGAIYFLVSAYVFQLDESKSILARVSARIPIRSRK